MCKNLVFTFSFTLYEQNKSETISNNLVPVDCQINRVKEMVTGSRYNGTENAFMFGKYYREAELCKKKIEKKAKTYKEAKFLSELQ